MLLTVIIFILILGLLVLVHELGHFLVARRNGVTAEEFGFGFPPRIVGIYRDKNDKLKIVWGNQEISRTIIKEESTVYSINLFPLGGFVKIKGEDGEDRNDPKSFANQSIWVRFKILSAGVVMNFILGIVLLAFALQIGLPDTVSDENISDNGKIQVIQVVQNSPASDIGVEIGDELLVIENFNNERIEINSVKQFQDLIQQNSGKEIILSVQHPGAEELSNIKTKIRETAPEGQGLLGIALAKTEIIKHGFFESFWVATKNTIYLIGAIIGFVGKLIMDLITSKPVETEVAGPIGIAVLTGQMTRLGLAYVLQFAAILSINLGVINFLPFPALDGGRVLFLGIEKLKGSPVSQKVEGYFHTAGVIMLLGLMVLITARDFINFEIVDKIKNIF
ncbi:MAG: site-2 protease family protein [Patescibacteria group bacterium]|jgi:regulator of sigma E protease|nr:site-2 protease family protein [Patescibacteria group bacterium]